jgi:hypothetical protein
MELIIAAALALSFWLSPIKKEHISQPKTDCVVEIYSYKIGSSETIHVTHNGRCNPEVFERITNPSQNTIIYEKRNLP